VYVGLQGGGGCAHERMSNMNANNEGANSQQLAMHEGRESSKMTNRWHHNGFGDIVGQDHGSKRVRNLYFPDKN
jgi:hypothetical protein